MGRAASNTSGKRNLRADMPQVAEWIDNLREAFGEEVIHDAIKGGMNGAPTFWARENGIEVGICSHDKGVTPMIDTPVEILLKRSARKLEGR